MKLPKIVHHRQYEILPPNLPLSSVQPKDSHTLPHEKYGTWVLRQRQRMQRAWANGMGKIQSPAFPSPEHP